MKLVKTNYGFGVASKYFKTKNNLYCVTANVHTQKLFIERNGVTVVSNLTYNPKEYIVDTLKKQLNIIAVTRVAVYNFPIPLKNKFKLKVS